MALRLPLFALVSRITVRALGTTPIILLMSVQLFSGAHAAPKVEIVGVQRLQPGWVRVYLRQTEAPANAHYQLFVSCSAATDGNSITTQASGGASSAIDIRVNLAWLTENGLPTPCHITHITAEMVAMNLVVAQALETVDVAMDLPLSHITPNNTPVTPSQSSVSLTAPSNYAAYPPLFVVVQSVTGRKGYVEIEELPSRGTLGLRALSSFDGSFLSFELGGGGEIQTGWGLDINRLGIWRTPELPVEIKNLGHDVFPYSGSIQPPLLSNNPSLDVFPAPPLFAESTYEAFVLNDRGVKRCFEITGCIDFTYDSTTHTLAAANGAKLSLLAPAAIVLGTQTNFSGPVHLAARPTTSMKAQASGATIKNLSPAVSRSLLETAERLSTLPGRDLNKVTQMPTALASSSAPMRSKAITRDRSRVLQSPEELLISQLARNSTISQVTLVPRASCVVNQAQNGVTSTPSACSGMSAAGFACPTSTDPIKVEAITTTSGPIAALTKTIPPYYAGRDNYFGTCGSHAATQYAEALLAKYSDDLAVKRVIYVDGEAIVVPDPRVSYSVSGGLAQLYVWDGTHSGDPPNDPWPPAGTPAFPNFVESYWPAREGDFTPWASANAANINCLTAGFWSSGFCIGQGHPGPGVYYDHSVMVKTLHENPLSDPPWSLADSYFNYVSHSIPLDDRDAAISAVINEISTTGLPVNLSFPSGPTKNTPDGSGGSLTYFSGMAWYLPPELGACDRASLDAVFAPGNGHDVNIVGYWVSGSMSSPDPFSSYFIIENNWGKEAGYHSFYFMNFAAFKYLANGLTTYRLDRTCWSVACEHRPLVIFPPIMLQQILYPPDPGGPAEQTYEQISNEARTLLGGVSRVTGSLTNSAFNANRPAAETR